MRPAGDSIVLTNSESHEFLVGLQWERATRRAPLHPLSPSGGTDGNENGIPDECEGAGLMMGGAEMQGEGFAGGKPTLPADPEAYLDAWVEYYEWLDEQEWGPDSERPARSSSS